MNSVLKVLFVMVLAAAAPASPAGLTVKLAAVADDFERQAPSAVSEERLLQRSYRLPHTGFAVGKAAAAEGAAYMVHEIICDYGFGTLKGSRDGNLLEMREIVAMDGRPSQTPASARKALLAGIAAGEERIRKKLLSEFTGLGLVDVASDYGTILLMFTTRGQPALEISPVGDALVGTEPASVFDWRQREGGALEYRGRKVSVRPMHGRIWIAEDGAPLRITATFEHEEPKHTLRDDAAVEYVRTVFGTAMPASVVHRHSVDNQVLTENLYCYGPFHRFQADTTIHFADGPAREPK